MLLQDLWLQPIYVFQSYFLLRQIKILTELFASQIVYIYDRTISGIPSDSVKNLDGIFCRTIFNSEIQ